MQFKFVKESFEDLSTGRRRHASVYTVYTIAGTLAGQFSLYHKEKTIRFEGTEISLEINKPFFRNPTFLLIDRKSGESIGGYRIFSNGNSSFHLMGSAYLPTGMLTLNNTQYNFRRIVPDVKYSFFKRDTWGYFKFRLEAIYGQEFYEYDMKVDVQSRNKPYHLRRGSFSGMISSNQENFAALFAGFYLMEVEFAYEDAHNT